MKKYSVELPTMYGDHHVIEVRRILLELPGVVDVYASSCFGIVEATYDPALINDLEIAVKLDEAGYLGEWSVPVEASVAAHEQAAKPFYRHTAVYETTRQVVSFTQQLGEAAAFMGRPLWQCPGMGAIKTKMED
jgi:copper chaperone CopZ